MSVAKESNGNWRAQVWYRDWRGERHHTTKRGFRTKADAKKWEVSFLARTSGSVNMTFADFYVQYEEDIRPTLREHTWHTKRYMIEQKILPAFADKKMCEITAADVLKWQNGLKAYRTKKGTPLSGTYMRTICNQLSAIFNHAVTFYGLKENPMRKTGKLGSKETSKEMQIWTRAEYLRFAEEMMCKPESFLAFELLYWTGMREGELLALKPCCFDLKKCTVRITESYQRLDGEDVITPPKTTKSIRTITMPDFLVEEVEDYVGLMGFDEDDRLFVMTKGKLYREMRRGCAASGVKVIRIHDLRHSHVSALIELGFTTVAIADRLGHESIDITFRYAHLFPNTAQEMANALTR